MMNKALLRRIADVIELDPEGYDQTTWSRPNPESVCGTSHCIAGHAVRESGNLDPDGCPRTIELDDGGQIWSWSMVAQHVLGLTDNESYMLFEANWSEGLTAKETAEVLRAIADGAPIEDRALTTLDALPDEPEGEQA